MTTIRAQGTTLQCTTISPSALVGEVTDLNGPNGSITIIDGTNLSSTAKIKLTGLKDEGQITVSLNFSPQDTVQQYLLDAFGTNSGTAEAFVLTFTDSGTTTATFSAFVTAFSTQTSVDSKVTGSMTLEITGAVTWAYA